MGKWQLYLLLLTASLFFIGTTAKPPLTIAILPLGDAPAKEAALLKKVIRGYYAAQVEVLPRQKISDHIYSHGDTIDAWKALNHFDSLETKKYDKLILFTDLGITIGDGNFITRGFAKINGRSVIVSSMYVRQEATSADQYKTLLSKVALHEAGHFFGLAHCENSDKCFMVSSLPDPTNYLNSDLKLCPVCRDQIKDRLK